MKIEKVFNYNVKDLVNFGMGVFIYKKGKLLGIITGIFLVSLVALVAINGRLGEVETFFTLFYFFILVIAPIMARAQMRKAYTTSKIFQEEQTFVLTDVGVYGKSDSGESKMDWEMFQEFVVYKKNIALYVSARQAFILPRKVFKEQEVNELIDFLTTNELTKKKTKISKYV